MSGGATFVLRLCKEYYKRKEPITVLLLNNDYSEELLSEVRYYSEVIFLHDYIKCGFKWLFYIKMGFCAPIDLNKIEKLIKTHKYNVHAMGVFGLLYASSISQTLMLPLSLTVGIYHQNEFMYKLNRKYYFSEISYKLLSKLDSKAFIFLNEENIRSYQLFLQRSLDFCQLVPVGVELPKCYGVLLDSSVSRRIVSVGNLYKFKTYNLHIINIMPELLNIDSTFIYEIYGDGEFRQVLESKVAELGLEGKVFINNQIPYSDFSQVVKGSFAFVGSGTAIVEAAALGVPSLIGIESSTKPTTYGFINDIKGFSYNEYMPDVSEELMLSKLVSITDRPTWLSVAEGCREKAKEFSIENTADGFEQCLGYKTLDFEGGKMFSIFHVALSFLYCAVNSIIGLDKEFESRREQGTIF